MDGCTELVFDDVKVSTVDEGTGEMGEEVEVRIVVKVGPEQALVLILKREGGEKIVEAPLGPNSIYQLGKRACMVRLGGGERPSTCCRVRSANASAASRLYMALESAQPGKTAHSWFEKKIDQSSAELYFHYYGTLQHQQNMLQDYIRTGSYYTAIQGNRDDFEGKTVMDVGAGSGILSLFAAQAGAKKVYAVEASVMAEYARKLAVDNPGLGERIEVVQGKVEEIKIEEKMDVLISEPIGTLLVNERMLETYLYARDHFLKPNGKMFPKVGRIQVAAFSDEVLHNELLTRAAFWMQENFYGVNVSSLHKEAVNQYFSQVVIDAFDPGLLVSAPVMKVVDFSTVREEELYDIEIPLKLTVVRPCMIHGIACWFDIFFDGSTRGEWLSTAPGHPATHWFQLRCVMQKPLWATGGCQVVGKMRLVAHARQSYDVHVTLEVPPIAEGMESQKTSGVLDLKEPYYRQLTSWWHSQGPAPPPPRMGGDMHVDGCG
ncbi:hypothetical protein BSKO_07197 [Bryopsis sp. KO-2023]|nr:hypothetical protein BSKO_07197 [Bryopsis sp. KO-2023]